MRLLLLTASLMLAAQAFCANYSFGDALVFDNFGEPPSEWDDVIISGTLTFGTPTESVVINDSAQRHTDSEATASITLGELTLNSSGPVSGTVHTGGGGLITFRFTLENDLRVVLYAAPISRLAEFAGVRSPVGRGGEIIDSSADRLQEVDTIASAWLIRISGDGWTSASFWQSGTTFEEEG